MKNYKERRINVFFVEIIIVIFFLMITSTILAMIFANTNSKVSESKRLSNIIMDVNSIAEVYSVNKDIEESLKTVYGGDIKIEKSNDKLKLNLEDGILLEIIETKKENKAGILKNAYLKYTKGENKIFDLNTSTYMSK